MTKYLLAARVACAVALALLLTVACAPVAPNSGTLTAADMAGLAAASRSLFAFAQAAGLAHAVAASQAGAGKPVDDTVAVEGCPVITLSPGQGTVLNVSVNFGAGCPLPGQETPVCSGAAVGQIDVVNSLLNLSLIGLTCTNIPTLDGNIAVTYSVVGSVITLDGTWNLTFTTETEQNSINGQGVVSFNPATQTATISQFTGQLTTGGDVWNITVNGVQISTVDNPSGLPFAGTVLLDGGFLRQFSITFNSDTPSTSVVTVGILGGLISFPVNVNTLNSLTQGA